MRGIKSCSGERSLLWDFSRYERNEQVFAGRQSPIFSFLSRENSATFRNKNYWCKGNQFKCCSSSIAEMLHKLHSNNFNNEAAHTASMVEMLHKIA